MPPPDHVMVHLTDPSDPYQQEKSQEIDELELEEDRPVRYAVVIDRDGLRSQYIP